jgi:hypothetical protein
MMRPNKWPVPQQGQVLTVQRPYPRGWLSGYFWPSGNGFHFISHAFNGSYCLETTFEEPVPASWIVTLGRTNLMMARGADARLVQMDESLVAQLEDWRAEIREGNHVTPNLGYGHESAPSATISPRPWPDESKGLNAT